MGDPAPQTPQSEEPSDDGGWEQWRALTSKAYERFQARLLALRPEFPGLTDFGPASRAEATVGTFAWHWGAAGEIGETLNVVNAWGMRLHEWGAWNQALDNYDEEADKWKLLSHFVEPVAFFCMLQPSSLADRLALVAETLLHQANQRIDPTQPDRLDQDKSPGRRFHPKDRLKQLDRLGAPWVSYPTFRNALNAMNGPGYKQATRNFRNLSAHAFAPRFLVGDVMRAIRSVGPQMELVRQPDGTHLPVEHPTKTCIQYGMNAIPPLDLDEARAANFGEYQKALAAMGAFAALVGELCDRMDAMPSRGLATG
jgi:hypothetical protein